MIRARVDRRTAATFALWLLLFASVVSWRKGVLYAGGADPVVLAKAVVAVVAAGGALLLWRSAPSRRVLSPYPGILVASIVAVSSLGAVAAGELDTNIVLTARITLLAVSIVLLLSVTRSSTTIAMMLSAMATIGVFTAVTGFSQSFLVSQARGRLGGGIPQLEPNELATLVLPAAIGLVFMIIQRGLKPLPVAGVVLLGGIILLTGSRTALLMVVIGGVVILVMVHRVTRGVAVALLVSVFAGYVILGFSSVLTKLALRDQGAGQLVTLNSRTISWTAVFAIPKDSWAWWIGSGLSVKSIAVLGQYWSTQVFDSSWISSIAQDGVVGTGLLIVYVLGTIIATMRAHPLRALLLALAVTTVIRSFLENGLIESSATFTVFFTLALASWRGTAEALTPAQRIDLTRSRRATAEPRVLRFPEPARDEEPTALEPLLR